MEEKEIKEDELKDSEKKEDPQEQMAYLDSKIDSLQDKMNSMDLDKRKRIFMMSVVGITLFIILKLVLGVMSFGEKDEEKVKVSSQAVVADSTDIILNELLSDEEVIKDPTVDSALNIIMKKK